MAAMASKFNFECVIQYYTDQCYIHPGKNRMGINDCVLPLYIHSIYAKPTVNVPNFPSAVF